ncbi:LEM domain-containing protein 1 isoform X2 [Rhinatrema bivittatum]|uniref:LEM domain-containing protein 1 isoform X2 n=1 Tax=Rhinatrema bivittatum TaxID=194408 RepID=UPI00112C4B28|nr:LEM domain-containing protein 1 isoform X2 [Rhinatrema bivittatum]
MPVFVEDPSQFTKAKLRHELISHNVPLPEVNQTREMYYQLYVKYIASAQRKAADFSSDEEDFTAESDIPSLEEGAASTMSVLDVKSLSNGELKEQLVKRGIRPGPILPTTRNVYEKKLLQMLDQGPLVPQVKQNGTGDVDQYSDSDEEGMYPDNAADVKSDTVTVPANGTSSFSHSKTTCYPGSGYSKTPTASDTHFSLTKMVEQIEKRSSGYKSVLESSSPRSPQSPKDRNTMTYPMPANTPKACTSDSHREDVLTEMFPHDTQSPLGMSATRRRPIKGAAGRPIQFKYDDIAAQAKLMEQAKAEAEKKPAAPRLMPVSLQIAVFAIMVFFTLVFFSMESNPDNPFMPFIERVEVQQAP